MFAYEYAKCILQTYIKTSLLCIIGNTREVTHQRLVDLAMATHHYNSVYQIITTNIPG